MNKYFTFALAIAISFVLCLLLGTPIDARLTGGFVFGGAYAFFLSWLETR
jgi:hypothetical protein